MTDAERLELLHRDKRDYVTDIFFTKIDVCLGMESLDLLRMDFSNCRCPIGCCQLGLEMLQGLDELHEPEHWHPKRIEIVGMLEREKRICRDMLAASEGRPSGGMTLDRVYFVNSPPSPI